MQAVAVCGLWAREGCGVVFGELFGVLELVLLIFCLIDCLQTPSEDVRNLPKMGWVLLIVILPLAGGIAWIVAGRPMPTGRPSNRPGYSPGFSETQRHVWAPQSVQRTSAAPDDDPEFLRDLAAGVQRRAAGLQQWEDDLLRREQEMRRREQSDTAHEPGARGATPPTPDAEGPSAS